TVLTLRYWSGLSPAQIARLLGEPEGTIRNRIFRAHLRLRGAIEAQRGGRRPERDHEDRSMR
ncbi:MAG: RNA polymerase sigma factor, partial [Planctomycetota bacterium]